MFLRFINILVLVISLKGFSQEAGTSFKAGQMKYERVKKAYSTKYDGLKKEIAAAGFALNKFEIYLRVFKQEKELQVWMKNKEDAKFKLFKTYVICASSGELGPKRKEGDGQVPEGFYEIESFNPVSSYHLSMKVNYPNKSDLKKANGRPGGDIMIHGNCVTIGCIPIENDPIEELYILSVDSRDRKNKLEVDIYPCKFSDANIKTLSADYSKELNSFWTTLKETYFYFEKNHLIPNVVIDKNGNYEFKK